MKVIDCIQGTEAWMKIRCGMPTASEFSKLLSGTGKKSTSLPDYARRLAGEIYAAKPLDNFEGNQWTEQGIEREADAADEYALVTDSDVQLVGFVTDDNQKFGCSPDRLVDDDGLLEIKCLSVHKHIAALQYIAKNGDVPPEYRTQVQGEILVCERDWCDMYFYHPDLPSKQHRVRSDGDFQKQLLSQITAVLAERDSIVKFLRGSTKPEVKDIEEDL